MPRKPLGTYTRPTADQFQHQRGRASASIKVVDSHTAAIGLFNNDQSGRVCHVLGVNVVGIAVLQPLWAEPYCQGGYYSGSLEPLLPNDSFFEATVEALFDLDPVPNVLPDAGVRGVGGFPPSMPLVIPLAPVVATMLQTGFQFAYSTGSYYPPGGVAAFKPSRGFALYCGDIQQMVWTAMFDFVMLPD